MVVRGKEREIRVRVREFLRILGRVKKRESEECKRRVRNK